MRQAYEKIPMKESRVLIQDSGSLIRGMVSFAECSRFHRVLLQKRLVILRSLLIAATQHKESRYFSLSLIWGGYDYYAP